MASSSAVKSLTFHQLVKENPKQILDGPLFRTCYAWLNFITHELT
jgi:hypothetical protein